MGGIAALAPRKNEKRPCRVLQSASNAPERQIANNPGQFMSRLTTRIQRLDQSTTRPAKTELRLIGVEFRTLNGAPPSFRSRPPPAGDTCPPCRRTLIRGAASLPCCSQRFQSFRLHLAPGPPWERASYGGQHQGKLPARLRASTSVIPWSMTPLPQHWPHCAGKIGRAACRDRVSRLV